MEFSSLANLVSGHVAARIIQVAVRLGIFDLLESNGATALSAASSLKIDARATGLLLDALVSLGLLAKDNDGTYSLNETSTNFLIRSSPRYLGGMILFDGSLWDCWGRLEEAIRSGAPVRSADMYQGNKAETQRFIYAMDSLVKARGDAEIVASSLDLDNVRDFLDIGGGPATYAIELCRQNPSLKATLFDLPGTLQETERYVKDAGLAKRLRLIAGDYRTDPIPGRYQLVFLSNIIHGEGVKENQQLMRKLHGCLDLKGRIYIKDHILDETLTQPTVGAIFALLMLLTTNHGRCYSFNEIKSWLEDAGFKKIKQLPLPSPLTSSFVIGEKLSNA